MPIRWKMVAVLITLPIILSSIPKQLSSQTASQRLSPAKARLSAAAAETSAIAIPDTTLGINSPTPMSQRIVHYQIEAKYDAATHTVIATEVLTYHNVTGEALDHFPFHLYQNAFQPKATFVRDRKSVV